MRGDILSKCRMRGSQRTSPAIGDAANFGERHHRRLRVHPLPPSFSLPRADRRNTLLQTLDDHLWRLGRHTDPQRQSNQTGAAVVGHAHRTGQPGHSAAPAGDECSGT